MIVVRDKLRGGHVHSHIWMGPDKDHLALTGTLVMRRDEWYSFWAILNAGVEHLGYKDDAVQFLDAKPIFEATGRMIE